MEKLLLHEWQPKIKDYEVIMKGRKGYEIKKREEIQYKNIPNL